LRLELTRRVLSSGMTWRSWRDRIHDGKEKQKSSIQSIELRRVISLSYFIILLN
jgi:hypothetical protein